MMLTQWPISYEEFENYYTKAEKLFRVKIQKNLSHVANQKLYDYLKSQGLNPYHLPLAIDDKKDCGGCQSYLCTQGCKNDSNKICIDPSIKKYGASLLTHCEVQKIEVLGACVSGVTATYQDQQVVFKAHTVLLAAGALKSPLILQNSGIGNQSGQLGRNLMRHYIDLYALKIDADPSHSNTKELAFDDFYKIEGQSLGTVQSFGPLPPVSLILDEMQSDLNSIGRFFGQVFKLIKPLFGFVLERVLANRLVIASIIEDTPQFENRVWSEDKKICIAYKISKNDQIKIRLMRNKMKALLKTFSLLSIPSAESNKRLAHVCGTCRMGTDPLKSVVDTTNKVHGIEGLYVIDSSFFPTSGGTNPSLTIAANSLRVADILIAQNKSKKPERAKTEIRGSDL